MYSDNRPETQNVRDLLKAQRQVADIWTTHDVIAERPDLNDDQAWAVLQECMEVLNSDDGFTWGLINEVAEQLYGPPPATDGKE